MKKLWVGMACVLSLSAVFAAEIEIGRAKLELSGEGWQSFDMSDGGEAYNKAGMKDSIPSETKIFVKEDANKKIQTVLLVRASQAGIGNGWMTYTHKCEGSEEMYAEGNNGTRTNNYDCLRVWPLVRMGDWLDQLAPGLRDRLKQKQLTLPTAIQPIVSHFANGNGSFVEVRAFTAPGFMGLEGQTPNSIPKIINPTSVVWAQALAKEVRGSVGSMSGRFSIPAIQYQPLN